MQTIPWKKCAVRCDNDRFAMITEPMKEEELRIRLLAFFAEISHLPNDKSYPVYFRCGVVQYCNMGQNKSIIADFAKMAQRLGIKQNSTEIHFYTEQMKRNVLRSETLKRELPNSIKNGELLVYLQPKFYAASDKIYGAEALIRWNYNKEKFLSPAEFVQVLELERVCKFKSCSGQEAISYVIRNCLFCFPAVKAPERPLSDKVSDELMRYLSCGIPPFLCIAAAFLPVVSAPFMFNFGIPKKDPIVQAYLYDN
jgi:hypothetical protein